MITTTGDASPEHESGSSGKRIEGICLSGASKVSQTVAVPSDV